MHWNVHRMQVSELGYDGEVWERELTGVVQMLLACFAAPIGPARQPAATSPEPR